MRDLQTVFIRNLVPVLAVDFITMLRVREVQLAGLLDVLVDGVPLPHMVAGTDEILVALAGNSRLKNVSLLTLRYQAADGSGFSETVSALAAGAPGDRVTEDHAVMRLEGEDFSKAIDVLVNGQTRPFIILSKRYVVATLPQTAKDLETVDVVVGESRLSRSMFFRYTLSADPTAHSGNFKAVSQFIRVLLSSEGSNTFRPRAPAGSLRSLLGSTTPASNRQAFLAKLALRIATTSGKFIAAQMQLNIPPAERISRVDLADVSFNPNDPTEATVSLRIVTFDQETAIFGLLLDTLDTVSAVAADISG